jgi:hypothetical protein
LAAAVGAEHGDVLLDDWGADPTPQLVVNEADDPYVPPLDITVFDGRPLALTPARTALHALHRRQITGDQPVGVGLPRDRLDARAYHRDTP